MAPGDRVQIAGGIYTLDTAHPTLPPGDRHAAWDLPDDVELEGGYRGLTPESVANQALTTMYTPVKYKPVETDGAARAARRIAEVLDNRWWVR